MPSAAQVNTFGDGDLPSQLGMDGNVYQFHQSTELFDFGSHAGIRADDGNSSGNEMLSQMDLGMTEFDESVFTGDLTLTQVEGLPMTGNPHGSTSTEVVSQGASAPTSILDTEDSTILQNLGYSSEGDPFFLQFYQYDIEGKLRFKELINRQVTQTQPHVNFFIASRALTVKGHPPSKEATATHERLATDLPTIVPSETGRRLLGLYDRFISPMYPIFSEEQRPSVERSDAHLLAAIYLSVQGYINFDEKLCIDLAYEPPAPPMLTEIVESGVEIATSTPDLQLVQTLILMVLQPYPNPVVSDTAHKWSLFVRLVAAAHTIGLHLDPSDWRIPSWQVALRRRLSFTIFSTDKWLAASLGRPPMVHPDNWMVTSLDGPDILGSMLQTSDWDVQQQYSALCTILADVLSQLYTLRVIQNVGRNDRVMLERARPLLEKLLTWQRLKYGNIQGHSRAQPLSDLCDIGHHFIKLLIFKAASRSLLSEHSTGESELNAEERRDARHFSRSGSKSATVAFADCIGALSQEHSDIFWPHWTQSAFGSVCFVLFTMALSSESTDEATSWFRELADLRRKIRLRSRAMPILRLGLLRVDSIFWLGPEKALKMSEPVRRAYRSVFADQDATSPQ